MLAHALRSCARASALLVHRAAHVPLSAASPIALRAPGTATATVLRRAFAYRHHVPSHTHGPNRQPPMRTARPVNVPDPEQGRRNARIILLFSSPIVIALVYKWLTEEREQQQYRLTTIDYRTLKEDLLQFRRVERMLVSADGQQVFVFMRGYVPPSTSGTYDDAMEPPLPPPFNIPIGSGPQYVLFIDNSQTFLWILGQIYDDLNMPQSEFVPVDFQGGGPMPPVGAPPSTTVSSFSVRPGYAPPSSSSSPTRPTSV